ncbi:hypothetical protein BASA81_006439 [Batrachochytrium salamandrivorans]|nr:hypothetical protein BASA81_006439 [Batrachochytrium salamandrivorans]
MVKNQRTKSAAACVDFKTWTSCIPSDQLMPKVLAAGQKASDLVGKQWCATAGYKPNDKTLGLNWGVCYTSGTAVTLDEACLFAEVAATDAPVVGVTGAPAPDSTLAPTDAPTPLATPAPTPVDGTTAAPASSPVVDVTGSPAAAPSVDGETLAPTNEVPVTTSAPTNQAADTAAPETAPEATASPTPIINRPAGFTLAPKSSANVASAGLAVVVTGLAVMMA